MRLPVLQSTLALLVIVAWLPSCGDSAEKPGVPVAVMTHNLYLGADLFPLATVPTVDAIPGVTANIWANVQASDYPSRAKIFADQIIAFAPDLVALQEVSLYRIQRPSDFQPGLTTPNATEVALDFLATLMAELDARGGGYRVAGEAVNAEAELPASDGAGGLFDLRLTDRDVILARDGVETAAFVQSPFPDKLTVAVGGASGASLAFTRSSSHLNASVGGVPFVFANGHLEVQLFQAIQMAQAQNMVDVLSPLPGPVILAGDFNSPPGLSSYPLITRAFKDAFPQTAGGAPGFTCCQTDALTNPVSAANERIDLILSRGPVRVKSVEVVGADPVLGRTPAGLWPSDHFGVFARLEVVP